MKIFAFMKKCISKGLFYRNNRDWNAESNADSGYANDEAYRKSTSYIVCMLVETRCKNQNFVSSSSTVAEYRVMAIVCEVMLKTLLTKRSIKR